MARHYALPAGKNHADAPTCCSLSRQLLCWPGRIGAAWLYVLRRARRATACRGNHAAGAHGGDCWMCILASRCCCSARRWPWQSSMGGSEIAPGSMKRRCPAARIGGGWDLLAQACCLAGHACPPPHSHGATLRRSRPRELGFDRRAIGGDLRSASPAFLVLGSSHLRPANLSGAVVRIKTSDRGVDSTESRSTWLIACQRVSAVSWRR